MKKRHFGKTMEELYMKFYDLQMFAEDGASGLTGDFDADFSKYVLGKEEEAGRDAAAEEEQDAQGAQTDAHDADTDTQQNADTQENAGTDTQQDTADKDMTADTDTVTDTDSAADTDMTDEDFDRLIKGRGKKAFGARTQKIIDGRFAKIKGQLQPLQGLAEVLCDKYGVKKGDIDALTQAVYSDNSMFMRQAMDAGISAAEYRDNFKAAQEQSKNEGDAELDEMLARETAAQEEREMQQELISAWQSQAAGVKVTYPDFDLAAELSGNESFRQLLTGERPLTVEEARRLAYYERDMAAITGKVAQSVREKTAQSIAANKARPPEGGLTRQSGGIVRRKDVSSLGENDILSIIDAVSKGAKISF